MNVAGSTLSPMMAQYMDIKEKHPDALLFFRMGDFYEMFFEDACAAAEALDIALTKRGKHLGKDVPMCGVPVHAADGHLQTLIRKGFRVAVCEQVEESADAGKRRPPRSVLKRDLVRLLTPGTITEDSLLEARRHNFLASYCEVRGEGALVWADISTGAFHVMGCSRTRLSAELARVAPKEVLVPETAQADLLETISDLDASATPLPCACFDSTSAERRMTSLFKVGSLDAFGSFSRSETGAMGAVVDYLDLTQKGRLPLLRPPVKERTSSIMQIDVATRRNLELTQALDGGKEGSLLSAVDRTVTAGGGRLLERRLSCPSLSLDVIRRRLDAVEYCVAERALSDSLRRHLRRVPDLDRALSRLSLDRGGPRDLATIRKALAYAASISTELEGRDLPDLISEAATALNGQTELRDVLDVALEAEPPLLVRDGGFIASGYDRDLDEARRLRDEGRGVIAEMQREYAIETGIVSLKIRHNNVLGYFVDVKANRAKAIMEPPFNEKFIHRQTTSNTIRFSTIELGETETRILNAGNHAQEIETRLFGDLRDRVLDRATELGSLALALYRIDLATALADLAVEGNWCRPAMENSRRFQIKAGRHPVVERALRAQDGAGFVANDCDLAKEPDSTEIWLLTGPNMAGKSTFLRQNALIAILAQMGSYVPASSASIGLISQLFSRVGASDNLARGRSTFMVEMVETAAILNQADDRALVILDEIGRGTSTYDGLSIAWATLEHLHDINGCRALFATHYHELTRLAKRLAGVENATVAVKEWEGEVIFLHEVRKGAADRSYGVQVARLAGLPQSVIDRAREILAQLESASRNGKVSGGALLDDLPLFTATPSAPMPRASGPSKVDRRIAEALPDELTPLEALKLVYELKELVETPCER